MRERLRRFVDGRRENDRCILVRFDRVCDKIGINRLLKYFGVHFMTFDVKTIRRKFPSIRDNNAIFFDNPAGTQVPELVMNAVTDYFLFANANSGGLFITSRRTDELVNRARRLLADFLNAPSHEEIVFGPNMTTLNFGLSRAIGKTLSAGDEIVLTRMDHDANVSPWLRIAEDHDLMVRWVDVIPEDGTLNMDTYADVLSERTKVVATVHASNALGTINPIAKIAEMAHNVGALHVVDAVQSAPHLPLDVQALGCDFLLCSAYKFFGPHVGVMWGRYDLLAELPAYKVRPAKDKPPYRWETGTPSFETIHGTAQAVEYIRKIGKEHGIEHADEFAQMGGNRTEIHAGMATLREYEQGLVTHLIEVLGRCGRGAYLWADGPGPLRGARANGLFSRLRGTRRTRSPSIWGRTGFMFGAGTITRLR